MDRVPLLQLADGGAIPAIGLGTYPLDDADAQQAVRGALELGYRLVDTAASYGNETGVGRGIADAGIAREDIFVTTKLRGRDQGYQETLKAFEQSRQRLSIDYVDLYLIHWPLPRIDKYVDSWRAMIKLRDDGLIRSLGVSNFTDEHLDRLAMMTGVVPVVNQIEMHPYFPQPAMRAADSERDIRTQSWSPLGRGSLLKERPVLDIAERHGVSPGQAVLRWHVQLGAIPIPKSADHERQQENLDIFGFALDTADIEALSALGGKRLGGNPDTHEEF